MNLYRVDCSEDKGNCTEHKTVWCGSQKAVADMKRTINQEPELELSGITVIDIPTDKNGLIGWLNKKRWLSFR